MFEAFVCAFPHRDISMHRADARVERRIHRHAVPIFCLPLEKQTEGGIVREASAQTEAAGAHPDPSRVFGQGPRR
jgi:hypothetical protein